MNSNQPCNECQEALADLNILKMNVSLLNSQCSSTIQNLLSSIAHLSQQVETLCNRVDKLEGNAKRNVNIAESPAIRIDLESQHVNESYTHIGSSTQTTKNGNGSSTQGNVSGPTAQEAQTSKAQTSQTITPFSEIIKAQMQEEARRKEKAKAIEASTSTPGITRNRLFDTYSTFQTFKFIVKKTGNMEISDPHVKYASHFAFNKVVAHPGTSPDVIKMLYQYGMLHAIYLSKDCNEISKLPEALQKAVKVYAGVITQYSIYIRFYSTVAEITPEKFYHPISLIRLGTTKKPIETEAEIKEDIEDDEEFQLKTSNIRAQNYHIIFQEMNRAVTSEEKQWVYYCGMTTLIVAFGKRPHDQPLFIQWYDRLRNNKMENPERTKKKICNILAEYSNHRCQTCEEREKAMQDMEDPEIDLSVL